jgi:hypothetical protein
LRKAVLLFELLNEKFGWGITEIPCFNSLENWIKKSGYSIYTNSQLKDSESGYGLIIDENLALGNERLVVTLGTKSCKSTPDPLTYGDVDVVGIHVDSAWDAKKITKALQEDEQKMGKKPDYVISDNDVKLCKAIAGYGCIHIRDIGHTLALLLQHVYEKDSVFCAFFKKIGRLKIKEVMSDCSYLLPPRQRTLARFMNLSHTLSWAGKVIRSFSSFTEKEKEVYRFVVQNKRLVCELQTIFECINRILSDIKTAGLSYHSIGAALTLINKKLIGRNKRVIRYAALVREYLLKEAVKLPSSAEIYNASGDMIESVFSSYKFRKSPNALHGVTSYILLLPLLTRMKAGGKGLDTNVKANLEKVYMRDLHQWTKEHLTENQTVKRRKKLAS